MAKQAKNEQKELQTILLDEDTLNADALTPALKALYSELGMEGEVDVTVHVSMLDSDSKGPEAGVWKGTPDEYDLESIAKRFGSGQYRVKVYVRNPDGSKPCRANKVFAWKLSPEDERKRKQALSEQSQPSQPAQAQPIMTPKEIADMITAAVTAAIPKTPSRAEFLTEMKLMADMFRPVANSGGDFGSTLKQLSAMQAFVKDLTPPRILNDEGKVDTGAVVMKALDAFIEAMARAKAGGAVAAQPIPPQNMAVAPAEVQVLRAADPAIDETALTEAELNEAMLLLKMQLKAALVVAKANGDPIAFADSVYEMLPDAAIDILETDAAWLDKLAEVNPDVKLYADWFNRLRTEILRIEHEDDSDAGAGG